MDPSLLSAITTTVGVIITALLSFGVAIITNRKASRSAAEDAADEASKQQLSVKDERITLRDEQIRLKEVQLADCLAKCATVQEELHRVLQDLAGAKGELSALKAERDRASDS